MEIIFPRNAVVQNNTLFRISNFFITIFAFEPLSRQNHLIQVTFFLNVLLLLFFFYMYLKFKNAFVSKYGV